MIEAKCDHCRKKFEKIIEMPNACPECIDKHYKLSLDEGWIPRDAPFIPNKQYKNKLQRITHRGKNKVNE
jgi:hypothetical protein